MLDPASKQAEPAAPPPGDFDRGHIRTDAQSGSAPVDLDGGHVLADAQGPAAPVDFGTDQRAADSHTTNVGADSSPGPVADDSQDGGAGAFSNGHSSPEARSRSAVGSDGAGPGGAELQTQSADPSDALLLILSDALDDLERLRIASENRLRSLTQVKGLGGSKAEAKLAGLTAALAEMEHQATLELRRAMRAHPLGPWVDDTLGLGEKQAARMIAAIGDPYWNWADDRPRRGPAELWAFCGYVPGQKRRKGVKSNWSAQAKMRAFLCAESCMKNRRSPYRAVYDNERAKWAGRDTTDGHRHNHALRVVAKAILRDLFLEAKRLRTTISATEPVPLSSSETLVAA